ncbi:MAG: hypothetical protein Q4F88_06980, partial [Eubacteriales bacterium]|nr:hypothetical protein [Eubacteriales bacterium]
KLLNTVQLDALSMYAVIRDLKNKGEEITYELLYKEGLYKNFELASLKKVFPLTVSKYDQYREMYSNARKLKKERQFIKAEDKRLVLSKSK